MSDVWKFFHKEGKAGTGDLVRCLVCRATLKQSMGSTSSMKKHLERLHSREWYRRNEHDDNLKTSQRTKSLLHSYSFCGETPASTSTQLSQPESISRSAVVATPKCKLSFVHIHFKCIY